MASLRRIGPGWGIFLLALALRLAWPRTREKQLTWPDEHAFVEIGRGLAHGDGFVASSYRNAPILPAYLGVVFRAVGEDYAAARVGQALLGAFTCVLVYGAGTLLASRAAGVLSGVLLALYPPQVYLAGVFYTSCLETFFCALTVYLAARVAIAREGIGAAALTGVALGLTVLTRPVFVVLGPSILVSWLWTARREWRRLLWPSLALVASAACTVLPWSLRNVVQYGRFVLVSSGGGVTLWKGNNELADGGPHDRFLKIGQSLWLDRLGGLDEATQRALREKYEPIPERIVAREREVGDYYLALDDVLGPVGRAYIAEAPGRALGRFGTKIGTLFSAFSRTSTATLPGTAATLAALSFYPLLALALLGVPLALPRARGLLLPLLLVVSFAAVHGLLTSCTRYRLPIDPYVVLFAACALVEGGRRVHGGSALALRRGLGWPLTVPQRRPKGSGCRRSRGWTGRPRSNGRTSARNPCATPRASPSACWSSCAHSGRSSTGSPSISSSTRSRPPRAPNGPAPTPSW